MTVLLRCSLLFAIFYFAKADVEPPRVATVLITSMNRPQTISQLTGTVVFTETENGLRIVGTVAGLPAGKYKFHVHLQGSIGTCDSTSGYFNPNNGSQLAGMDYVEVTAIGIMAIDIVDTALTLRGDGSVLGRSLVLHQEATGASARVGCGVIGIMAPTGPWNSAVTSTPSLLLFISAAVMAYCRQ